MDRAASATEAALAMLRRVLRQHRSADSAELAEALERFEPFESVPPQASQSNPRQVAALPWRWKKAGKTIEVMLVTSRDTGRWVVPKGWPESGETLWDAAAREAGEEAGLKGAIAEQEIGFYLYDKVRASGRSVRCEVLVYPLEVRMVADKWPEKGQRKRAWMSPAEAAAKVREPDLAKLIAGFDGRDRSLAA